MNKLIKIFAVVLSLSLSFGVLSSPDGFVYHINDQASFSVYEDGFNKGLYKIKARIPNTSCLAEISAFTIQPAYNSDSLGFSGRVESLTCDDPIEEKIFSGRGGVTGMFNESKQAVSEMTVSLWFF